MSKNPSKDDYLKEGYIDFLKDSGIDYIPKQQEIIVEQKAHAAEAINKEKLIKDEKQIDNTEFIDSIKSEPEDMIDKITISDFKTIWELQEHVLQCRECVLNEGRQNVVFGDGDESTDLMFIGEGPGAQEDIQGKPFVGRAGKLLDKMILAMGYKREEVYIANIVKCRPPNNRDPLPDEVALCVPYLKAQIKFIKPKIIVLLGSVAVKALLNTKEGITKIRGQFMDYEGVPLVPVYHPAYLLRSPGKKKEAWEDLQKVMKFLGKEIPEAK